MEQKMGFMYKTLVEELKGKKEHLVDVGVDRMTTVKCILHKQGMRALSRFN
jgi:hypothetical protein